MDNGPWFRAKRYGYGAGFRSNGRAGCFCYRHGPLMIGIGVGLSHRSILDAAANLDHRLRDPCHLRSTYRRRLEMAERRLSCSQLRPSQLGKFAQQRPCVARVDNVFDVEFLGCAKGGGDGVQPRLDFLQLGRRIVVGGDFGFIRCFQSARRSGANPNRRSARQSGTGNARRSTSRCPRCRRRAARSRSPRGRLPYTLRSWLRRRNGLCRCAPPPARS